MIKVKFDNNTKIYNINNQNMKVNDLKKDKKVKILIELENIKIENRKYSQSWRIIMMKEEEELKLDFDIFDDKPIIKDIEYNEEGVSRGLAETCLNHKPTPKEEDFLAGEIMKCSKLAKIEIMRDHTNLDWRDFLPEINIPTLVFVGRKSQVFPWQGSKYVADVIPDSELEIFENCGHMLFWDEPQKFNKRLSEFIDK
jgi:homoserine acetyltransferase